MTPRRVSKFEQATDMLTKVNEFGSTCSNCIRRNISNASSHSSSLHKEPINVFHDTLSLSVILSNTLSTSSNPPHFP
ncbi:hypothetical protein HanRHA438_Chr16g0754121 [Helianthus annuus]|nr:hypothetical protein HanHA300_Chr16g0605341 [Helianthus annuus]KAJ0442234.1 hypothetical protein HanIR_Chr16g0806841 [Helianthus annuus]KAJ0460030.1 hypothetical protein HanHA89_Chr16g0655881 [Helianthus annuus]KAJ0640475.1 hypothetical protein HanLR1_Chr16g0615931 [Helianthus annuus]KAJ0640479.1 hypothetical protein HanLR1_Chr16g0615981 [Helianthus annuus]